MALIDIIKKNSEKPADLNQLNQQELQLILSLLRQSNIKGEQVEIFYNLVLKLQNQFLLLSKENSN